MALCDDISGVSGWVAVRRAEEKARRDKVRRDQVMALPVVEVRHHRHLDAPRDGCVQVCASVGPAGEAVAVWTAAEDLPAVRPVAAGPSGSSFAGTRASWPVRAFVTVHAPDIACVTPVSRLRLAHLTVQPLPGGAVLLVGARCRWRNGGPDRNAVIYGADGKKVAEEVLGDGIEHVLTDSAGHVWVGYFDEGVGGNKGWGDPGPEPMGRCGLARFSPDLRSPWQYPSAGTPFGGISDCYALNVDGTTAWTSYYTSFPVVRVSQGVATGWSNDVVGARGIAVAGSRAALFGGYGPNHDRLAIGKLQGGHFRVAGEYRLALPGGAPLPPRARVIGRGCTLHFFVDDDWYQFTLYNLPPWPVR